MKRLYATVTLTAALLLSASSVRLTAQYFNIGQRPWGQSWRMIKSDSLTVVFPQYFEDNARRMLYYMERSRDYLGYGFDRGPMRTPVMFSTQNFSSNGMAMLAPRRIEIISIPSVKTYSEPWLKQLAVHEYRHMVQYNNINRSTVKVLGYLLGQQAPFAATALIPFWFIEGDAVMAETQASEFGRGLQPSFSMHYRALGRDILEESGYWKLDKWFAGSIKEYVPSHYELGYQMVAHSMRRYGTYIGREMYRYSSDYPFLLSTAQIALRKYYGTSTPELFRSAFEELNDHWDSLGRTGDSASKLPLPATSYTTYSYPQYMDDKTLIVLKSDYDRYSRFVEVDLESNSERTLAHTGVVSSRPAFLDGRIWWTEYRQSTLWEQRINSQLCYADAGQWRVHTVNGVRTALFPAPISRETVAYVDYDYSGRYYAVCGEWRFEMPAGMSVHGLAWDDVTRRLYMICLDDRGMGIASVEPFIDNQALREDTLFSYITLSDLRACGGVLYFGSIASGYDEIHALYPDSGKEYVLTESQYGAFTAGISPDNTQLALTVYDSGGYKLAVQPIGSNRELLFDHLLTEQDSFRAKNTVNPDVPSWNGGTPIMPGMEFTVQEREESVRKYETRRYRRALRLFNLHSWLPVNFDPLDMNSNPDLGPTYLGVTLMSQSLMGDMESMVRYGVTEGRHSLVSARLSYLGLPLKLSGDFTWSDRDQLVVNPVEGVSNPAVLRNYMDAGLTASVPLLLSSGYMIRWLTPALEYRFNNMKILNPDANNLIFKQGEHRLTAYLQLSGQTRMAELDIYPRWGYVVRGSVSTNTGNTSGLFRRSWTMFGRVYTPGLAPHHGLTLAAGYQNSFGGGTRYIYSYDMLVPHGYGSVGGLNYSAAAASYQLPLCYPDAGLRGVVFLKRIRLSAQFEIARYKYQQTNAAGNTQSRFRTIYAAGGTLYFDVGFFRLPSVASSTITLSVYFPKDGSSYVSGGFSIPF